jgi:uncharacterized repeat protein (TIGR02543 family)
MKIQVKIFAVLMLLFTFAIMGCGGSGGWDNPSRTYTVTFDSQGATVEADPTTKTVTSPATTIDALPTEPTRTGYAFDGWYTEIDGGGTEFTAATTVTADITVYANWTETIYAVGNTGPGGGTVFYITADGKSGLEVAPVFWSGGPGDPSSAWSNVTSTAVGTTGTLLGTGLTNSNAIIAQGGHTASAAKLCRDYTGGGMTDWFLPSRDELTEMYAQRAFIGGLSADGSYWSSSEANASEAILVQNSDGVSANMGKNTPEWVHAIRYFGTTPLITEYLNDGFESGAIGSDWLSVMVSGSGGNWNWTIVTSGTYPNNSHFSGKSARLYRSSGFAIPATITSVTLTFYMYHDTGYSTSADRALVQVSTDGGSNWADVGSAINRYDGSTGWKQHTIDLTAYAGQTIILGFLGVSAYGNNMTLDDVLVTGRN